MLTKENKAGALWASMALEVAEYDEEMMKALFLTLSEKSPEYINEFLEFLRTTSTMTFRLYCEIMANYTATR